MGMDSSVSELHPLKAAMPRAVSPSGRVIPVREEQPLKASLPISVATNPLTVVRALQSRKVPSAMRVRVGA